MAKASSISKPGHMPVRFVGHGNPMNAIEDNTFDRGWGGAFRYHLAQALAPLRDAGVLVIVSGNIVHHLRLFRFDDSRALGWAVEFDTSIRSAILVTSVLIGGQPGAIEG